MKTLKFHKISDIVKQYIIENNNKNDDKYIRCSHLAINKSSADTVKIAQFQPNGSICVDFHEGSKVTSENHLTKVNDFLSEAYRQKADLVLTPEYCVPYESLDELLQCKDQIKVGTLYCLCMEGANKEKINNYISKWSQNDECYIYSFSYDNSDQRNFWCILFYVFKISFFVNEHQRKDIVFIIPQCKTTHMKDDSYYFETGHLSTGDDVFLFDLEHENKYTEIGKCNNIFFSLLCSDVFEYEQFINLMKDDEYKEKGFFIFHPQLNSKPYHGIFVDFRRKVLNDLHDRAIIITSTWGKNTKVNNLKFEIPNSAIYIYNSDKYYIKENQRLLCANNK